MVVMGVMAEWCTLSKTNDDTRSTLVDYTLAHGVSVRSEAKNGSGANCSGRGGEDTILKVPVGTTIVDTDSVDIIGDSVDSGQRVIVANGW